MFFFKSSMKFLDESFFNVKFEVPSFLGALFVLLKNKNDKIVTNRIATVNCVPTFVEKKVNKAATLTVNGK